MVDENEPASEPAAPVDPAADRPIEEPPPSESAEPPQVPADEPAGELEPPVESEPDAPAEQPPPDQPAEPFEQTPPADEPGDEPADEMGEEPMGEPSDEPADDSVGGPDGEPRDAAPGGAGPPLGDAAAAEKPVQRYGMVIGLKEDAVERYKQLHTEVWPEVKATIKDCNIGHYSIFLRKLPDGTPYLFAYFEYAGDDFDADMERMGTEVMQRWWAETDPLQVPFEDRGAEEWWAPAAEVFRFEGPRDYDRGTARRFSGVIGVREEAIPRYKELHAETWPGVLRRIEQSNIRRYSIFLRKLPDGNHYLFSYYEYIGDDFQKDQAAIAADATMQEWWKETDPLQVPLEDRGEGKWWADMEPVFHLP